MSLNITFRQLVRLSSIERADYCQTVLARLGHEFSLMNIGGTDSDPLPTLKHDRSNLTFKVIPSGEFLMGLTEEHERIARTIYDPLPITVAQLRPVRRKSVGTFLMTRTPLLAGDCRAAFQGIVPRLSAPDPFPAYLPREAVERVAASIDCRLPTETEWEY